jgi:hypothetical protein
MQPGPCGSSPSNSGNPAPVWNLSVNSVLLGTISTEAIYWPPQTYADHGIRVEYMGEITKLENNMGDWYPGVRIDQPKWLDVL